jgi:hypothetical protein
LITSESEAPGVVEWGRAGLRVSIEKTFVFQMELLNLEVIEKNNG